jgi:hypothetical protein
MTANISEHLKKNRLAWAERMEGCLPRDRWSNRRQVFNTVYARHSVSATVAQSWLRAGQMSGVGQCGLLYFWLDSSRVFPAAEVGHGRDQAMEMPDNYWDGIFMEHVLEHLSYKDAIFAIGECYRTLKLGAWLRISVPDIDKFIGFEHLKDKYQR